MRKKVFVCFAFTIFLMMGFGIAAAQDAIMDSMDQVLSGLDFASVADIQITMPGKQEKMSVESLVRALAAGETISAEALVEQLFGTFLKQV